MNVFQTDASQSIIKINKSLFFLFRHSAVVRLFLQEIKDDNIYGMSAKQ